MPPQFLPAPERAHTTTTGLHPTTVGCESGMLTLVLEHHGRAVQVPLHDHLALLQSFRAFVTHGGKGPVQLPGYPADGQGGGLVWPDAPGGRPVASVELRCDPTGFNVGGVTLPWSVLRHRPAQAVGQLVPCMRCDALTSSAEHLCDDCRTEYRHYLTSGHRCPCCGRHSVIRRQHEATTEAWEDCTRCAYTHDFPGGDTRAEPQSFLVQHEAEHLVVRDALGRILLAADVCAALALAHMVRSGQADHSPPLRHPAYHEHLHVWTDGAGGVHLRRTDGHAHLEGTGPVVIEAELHLPDAYTVEAFARALTALVPDGTLVSARTAEDLWSAR